MGRSRIGAAVLTAALVALPVGAESKTAGRGDVITVSGASIAIIEISLAGGGTAEGAGSVVRLRERNVRFGTNLAPDGAPSDSPDGVTVQVDPSDPSAGACYAWAGAVTVRSNRAYAVTVSASATNDRLDFLTSGPVSYGACVGGETVAPSMFPGAGPAGAWVTGQGRTSGRSHAYWLGLEVRWTDAPSSAIADTTLTFTAVPLH